MTVALITEQSQFEDRIWCAPIPFCMFCDTSLSVEDLPLIKFENDSTTLFLHKNCAIAWSAQIQNELEKILG